MSTFRFVLTWLVAIGVLWLVLGALVGGVVALLILALGTSPAAWLTLAAAVIAIGVGALDYAKKDSRR